MPQTKEDKAAYDKKRYEENKDKINAANKKWREQRPNYDKEYRLTEAGIKSRKINNWKRLGMVAVNNDWDYVYDTYMNTTCCNFCCKEFISSKDKHLDHDHETGEIRGVLCCSCNRRDVFAST